MSRNLFNKLPSISLGNFYVGLIGLTGVTGGVLGSSRGFLDGLRTDSIFSDTLAGGLVGFGQGLVFGVGFPVFVPGIALGYYSWKKKTKLN